MLSSHIILIGLCAFSGALAFFPGAAGFIFGIAGLLPAVAAWTVQPAFAPRPALPVPEKGNQLPRGSEA